MGAKNKGKIKGAHSTKNSSGRTLSTAIATHQRGDLVHAAQLYQQILKKDARNVDALHLLGLIAHQQGKNHDAVELMAKSIKIEPRNAVAHCNHGAALMELGRIDDALHSYDKALAADPSHVNAYVNRALVFVHTGRLSEALVSLESALNIEPMFLPALYNNAKLLVLLNRPDEADAAISLYARALSTDLSNTLDLNNLGALLQSAGRTEEAVAFLTYAINAEQRNEDLLFCRGNSFVTLNRLQEACVDFQSVLGLNPEHLGALNNLGNTFISQRMFAEALDSYERVVSHFPDVAIGHYNRGNALHELGRWEEALQSYEKALELQPGFEDLLGKIVHLRGRLCDWRGDSDQVATLIADTAAGHPASEAFPLFMLTDDPSLLRGATERWVKTNVRASGRLGPLVRRSKRKKIHIAYFSGDFHEHATSYLTAEMFERHDREQFEVTAISFGPDQRGGMRNRLMTAFDRFEDVKCLSDLAVAARCRELEIDIAIDLKAYLQDRRPNILAERCAPIQINWLAFPGTMASSHIDYIVADKTLITLEDLEFYSEKIIWLPDSYQVNDGKRPTSFVTVTRAECGLPEKGFVFCCFNNNFKIRPETFDIWMRILERTPGSVLWLLGENPILMDNLRREAHARGVDPTRLVFAARAPLADHLARHQVADLFLDTWPCNAHTTASDALWAGLPVLTRLGKSFSSRVGSSLVRAVGLPELSVLSNADYEELAIQLGNNPVHLIPLRQHLLENRTSTALFDCQRFTRNLEFTYLQIMERYWSGKETDHVTGIDRGAQPRYWKQNVDIDDFVGNGLRASRRPNPITSMHCQ